MAVEIPKTEDMGWKLNTDGKRVYRPSRKSFWNRLEFIVKSCGGSLDRTTTGFTIEGGRVTQSELSQINQEIESCDFLIETPDDIETSKHGRETPNLKSF